MAIECEQLSTEVGYDSELQSSQDPGEDDEMSFPETVSESLFRNYLVVQTHSLISCPGGWSQTIPQVKKPHVEVLDWRDCTWSVVVRLLERSAKFSKMK